MSHLLSISMRYAVSSRFEHFIFLIFYFANEFGSIRAVIKHTRQFGDERPSGPKNHQNYRQTDIRQYYAKCSLWKTKTKTKKPNKGNNKRWTTLAPCFFHSLRFLSFAFNFIVMMMNSNIIFEVKIQWVSVWSIDRRFFLLILRVFYARGGILPATISGLSPEL